MWSNINKKLSVSLILFIAVALLISSISLAVAGQDEKPNKLTILWAAWTPADQLETMCEEFTEQTGVEVEVIGPPWDNYLTKTSVLMSQHSTSFDLALFDSQWKGWLVEGGHVFKLNDWLEQNESVSMDDWYPNLVKAYSEYPEGSGNYYMIPLFADTELLMYRTDLFNDPQEKANFKVEYGYELKPPETWSQLRDIAEFFNRPEENLYGLATKMGRRGDYITWDFNQVLWAFGGSFWNPETKKVDGYINSPKAVEALEFYKSLVEYSPPGAANFGQDAVVSNFQQGLVAMSIQWTAFAPGYVNCEASRTCDSVGFTTTPEGSEGWYPTLGGQGIGVNAYTPHKDWAFKLLGWLASEEAQKMWAKDVPAGVSGYKSVVGTEEYETYQPWYAAQKEQAPAMRDIWSIPEYASMLELTQNHLNNVITGKEEPKEALDNIAQGQEQLLEEAGYYD
ncbi:MAG: sugar ABC transporter substrate-binding protein [Candidatus Bipolaricaulota bacterium]|nr:sugar ABC transporter substrate-binding protein [Candidatus Bipolaricaulota bacterium]